MVDIMFKGSNDRDGQRWHTTSAHPSHLIAGWKISAVRKVVVRLNSPEEKFMRAAGVLAAGGKSVVIRVWDLNAQYPEHVPALEFYGAAAQRIAAAIPGDVWP
jgi:hypothetical protein